MDKEKLLTYFQDHYLSRQEVLFKLPLSYSIDTFWPELLNRRKAQASILPLYNAAGMPYWYSLTPGMVQASERLCEEAISQQKVFDPYRAEMTSAMTEEMFFTSFVEGAQIPLQAAMDFLQRGTEPESIQEQMIWNNRRAWAEMIGAIYRPLDEPFVKSLAFMLTEEMDGCAADYRQMDSHPIAAMNAEPYDVPPAYCLQDRMNEYYSFLQQGGIHPLIKASAAQAFLLVTRPFPEGNERLSRMISSAVLLRSGYDFFRDISISSVIARESYRYYKSMCEIIRGENGGDLTYFMDYYLGLLVRALDARNERIRRREQEALARERELALVPLQPEKPPEEEKPARKKKEDPQEKPKAAKSPGNGWPKHERKEGTLMDPVPLRDYLEIIDEMRESKYPGNRAIPDRIHHLVDIGKFSFTVAEYAEETGLHRKDADVECRKLYDKGLLDRHMRNGKIAYSLQVSGIPEPDPTPPWDEHTEPTEPASEKPEEHPDSENDFWDKLEAIENSKVEGRRIIARLIRENYENGMPEFTPADMVKLSGLEKDYVRNQLDRLVNQKMIINQSPKRKFAVYRLAISLGDDPEKAKATFPKEIMEQARSLGYDSLNERDQRIGRFMLKIMEKGICRFTTEDWENEFHVSSSVYGNDLRRAVNLGIITKHCSSPGSNQCYYTINTKLPDKVRTDDLTDIQKEYLTRIYRKYHDSDFTVEDIARLLGVKASSANFHLMNFAEREILFLKRQPGKAHRLGFAVTPENHPECFINKLPVPVRMGSASSGTEKRIAAAV